MRALVLSGGGSKGAFQVGVLERLVERGADWDMLCGVSIGAVNAAKIAEVPRGGEARAVRALRSLWERMETRDIRRDWSVFGKAAVLWKPSMYDSAPLRALLQRNLDLSRIRASKRVLRVGSVSWQTGAYRSWSPDRDDFLECVLASAAFPVLYPPVSIDGVQHTDGGVRNVTPLGDAIRLGATEIDVVLCSRPRVETWPTAGRTVLGYAERALEVLADEVVRTDLQVAGLKNDLVTLRPEFRRVAIRVYQPSKPFEWGPLDLDRGNTARAMAHGREVADG